MKFFSTPKWGRTLCMLLLTMAAMQASAATKTEKFTTAAWPTGWELGGTATATDYQVEYDASNDYNYPTGRRGVYGQVASGTEKYILTPFVTGQGSLKFKRRNSSNGSIYIYKVESNGELSAQPIASNTSRPTSWTTVSFDLGSDSHRLAIVLNGRMDDILAKELAYLALDMDGMGVFLKFLLYRLHFQCNLAHGLHSLHGVLSRRRLA
jgi:hypothetical protein